MARYSAGVRTGAGSTTLPLISLYGVANIGGRIREIGLTNTTAIAVAVMLARFTTAGTPGTGLVEAKHDPNSPAASLTAFTTHSSTPPTLGDDLGYRAALGAAVGAGVIWTFGESGLLVPTGTANGVGVLIATGTGQVLDAYIVWDE